MKLAIPRRHKTADPPPQSDEADSAAPRATSPLTERDAAGEPETGVQPAVAERPLHAPAKRAETTLGDKQPRPAPPLEGGKGAAVRATVTVFRERGVTNWAAALTYYAVLALFPAMIALVSLLGVVGSSAIDPLLENLTTAAPGPARDLLQSSLEGIEANPGASGVTFVVGLLLALWAASGYVGAFMDASNAIYGTAETRPFWKKLPLRLFVTTVLLTLLAICAIAVVLTGDLASRAGDIVGAGGTAVDAWNIAKWPVLLIAVAFMLGLLYWAAPDVNHPRGFRPLSVGSLVAMGIWLAASALFGVYVANFGSYNQTYGALGGAVVFLVWLWITNIAVLIGAALNSQLEARREP